MKVIKIAIAILMIVMVIMPYNTAEASQIEAGFYVSAMIPSNQTESGLSYFDLHMEPEQVQRLEVEIVNEADTPITVTVEAVSASTNRNGVIDYKTPDIRDKSLMYPFADIAEVNTPDITVPPNSTKTAVVTLTMPEEYYDGVILGGLVFTRENDSESGDQTVTVNNIFSYVIGVKLSETDIALSPNFEIAEIVPKIVNYQPVFMHGVRNTEAVIVKGMNVDVYVKDISGKVHAQMNKTDIDMAPNSVMPLGIEPMQGKISPGKYVSEIQIEYNGETYSYSDEFYISGVSAKETNSSAVKTTAPVTGNSDIQIVMIGFILVLCVIIVILLFLLVYKKRENKNVNKNT
jgi:Bacterial protein of unknown function (DUF916)./Protein of unknown function C-terminal (DUF3324).